MAWRSTGAWKPPQQPQSKTHDDSKRTGLSPADSPDAGPKAHYIATQNDEVMVLKSIYADDYVEHKAANTAWKKSEPSFDIRVKAPSDVDMAVTLSVVLTATYPKSIPLLSLKDDTSLSESILFKLQGFIETRPKALAISGEPMIHDLVDGIQDILEDAAQIRAQGQELPSLEEERAAHESELAKQALEQQQEEERKQKSAAKEEEKMMHDKLQQEVDRQRLKVKESKKRQKQFSSSSNYPEAGDHGNSRIVFDHTCKITNIDGLVVPFDTVIGKALLQKGPVSTTYRVWPAAPDAHDCHGLALKEFELRSSSTDSVEFKQQLGALEKLFESIAELNHRNIMPPLNYRIDPIDLYDDSPEAGWVARVLTPLADKGPLGEILELTGHLDVGKVRSWTADLLSALEHLRTRKLVHQDIHLNNILLFRETTGDIVPKLSDIAYQSQMYAICGKSRPVPSANSAKSSCWLAPEVIEGGQHLHKTDLWDLGVVFLQMIFGLDVVQRYRSPSDLIESIPLSSPCHELVARFFRLDNKKSPRAFELSSSEFLATDAPVVVEESSAGTLPPHSLSSAQKPIPLRLRRESTAQYGPSSRYREDFVEEGQLGKGGFGQVVKARKKLDGQIYAIKKISQRSQESLSEVLKEVRLLSQISHPAVVRYYNTWLEETFDLQESDDSEFANSSGDESNVTATQDMNISFAASAGGLDFISTSLPNIEFGYDSDNEDDNAVGDNEGGDDDDDEDDDDDDDDDENDEESEEDEDDEDDEDDDDDAGELDDQDGNVEFAEDDSDDSDSDGSTSGPPARLPSPAKVRNERKGFRTVMYISMEYCENKTLRDLIKQDLRKETDEIWRLFRQILEGLVHIHGMNIVHRDLKPDNIFIAAGPDGVNNVKIGDFGLATSGHFAIDKSAPASKETNDQTRSVGTSFYVAPEVRRNVIGSYTAKVDMYSLGIILFEMCYHPIYGMERYDILSKLGEQSLIPDDFGPDLAAQADIVRSLVTHDVKARPSSTDLLRSGKLPIQMENETTRRALASLTTSTSPYYPKVVATLFNAPLEPAKDLAWDLSAPYPTSTELLLRGLVKEELTAIFRRHGAVEAPRSSLYPRSPFYLETHNTVHLLDQNGTVVQLPFDLMLGNARLLAKQTHPLSIRRSYTFGHVYRDRSGGGQPQMIGEVDFDIISTDKKDLTLKEAEVIKVLDEIIQTFPSTSTMCFHLGHADLLELIFDYCGVDRGARQPAAEMLTRLNVHSVTLARLRPQLRSPTVGVSATSYEGLRRFDFCDMPAKAFQKLKSAFGSAPFLERLKPIIAHLKAVIEHTTRLGVHAKIYINPLSSIRANFFAGGILFQCLHENGFKDVFAAGGRYDSLIEAHRPKVGTRGEEAHAVGFSLAWEKLARPPKPGGKALKKPEEESQGVFSTKRCDVLIASFDAQILRTTGLELLSTLWKHDISAELARDSRSPEELANTNRDESYTWIVIIKPDTLKIRTPERKDIPDAEIAIAELVPWLKAALRERGSHIPVSRRVFESSGSTTSSSEGANVTPNLGQEVRVLVAGTKSKKFNRQAVIDQAQVNAAGLVQSFLDGPIAAVETSDRIIDLIKGTTLSEAESWRKAEQKADKNDVSYMRDIHGMLLNWRTAWETRGGSRHAFVYNFRTTKCVYYDLGA